MPSRFQRTLARPAEVRGFGLFGGRDVVLRCLPAPPNHGLAFQRVDLPGQPRIPALVRYVQPRPRRTALARGEACVETTEHVLAALAGLAIDNCLIQLDALEPPAGDGSSREIVDALQAAGIVEQPTPCRIYRICTRETVPQTGGSMIELLPSEEPGLTISCEIDYPGTAIGRQSFTTQMTPERFSRDIAPARTFVLEAEVAGLQAQGYGLRVTTDNVLVFGPAGPIRNHLHFADECARHKVLDCVGDFALLGCLLQGEIRARQSGHALNHAAVRRLVQQMHHRTDVRAAG